MQNDWLEQELFLMLNQAIAHPDSADMQGLLSALERALAKLPQSEQLRVAGNVLAQLVEIHISRANYFLDSWEEKNNPIQSEPVLTVEMLQEVLRQTMTLNLQGALEEPEFHRQSFRQHGSVAGEVEKVELLEFLANVEQEQAKQKALAVSHDEDVSTWTATIAQWMQTHQIQAIPLLELQQSLQMPLISLWLALLLGGYPIEQRGDFYQTDGVWIRKISPSA